MEFSSACDDARVISEVERHGLGPVAHRQISQHRGPYLAQSPSPETLRSGPLFTDCRGQFFARRHVLQSFTFQMQRNCLLHVGSLRVATKNPDMDGALQHSIGSRVSHVPWNGEERARWMVHRVLKCWPIGASLASHPGHLSNFLRHKRGPFEPFQLRLDRRHPHHNWHDHPDCASSRDITRTSGHYGVTAGRSLLSSAQV